MHISIEIMRFEPERNDYQIKVYFLQHLTPISCFQNGSLCCWVTRGQYRVSRQGRIHNGSLVVSMQGNIRAWTRNLKKKIHIDSFNFIIWMGQSCDIYIFIYLFFNFSYNPTKRFNSSLNYPYFGTWQLSEFTHLWVKSVSAWFNCPHQLRLQAD